MAHNSGLRGRTNLLLTGASKHVISVSRTEARFSGQSMLLPSSWPWSLPPRRRLALDSPLS
jgi:hypothetical protein